MPHDPNRNGAERKDRPAMPLPQPPPAAVEAKGGPTPPRPIPAPPPAASPEPRKQPPVGPVSFTVFESEHRLSKRFTEGQEQRIDKHSGVRFFDGRAERITLKAGAPAQLLKDLNRVIETLSAREAIGLGVALNGAVENV